MLKRIDHIDIAVKDVQAAAKLLEDIGFEYVRRTAHHAGTVEMKLPGDNQPILDLHPSVPEHGADFNGVVHIAFEVDDLDATQNDMKAKGIRFSEKQKPHLAKTTGRVMFNICDPEKLDSSSIDGWGLYLQFVDPDRREPV